MSTVKNSEKKITVDFMVQSIIRKVKMNHPYHHNHELGELDLEVRNE
jgi:hypothetical protein